MFSQLVTLLLTTTIILSGFTNLVHAESVEYDPFSPTWDRTDRPVQEGLVARTWMWGPNGNPMAESEPYDEASGGERQVLYFDKARMEITNPDADPNAIWYVTNGLLVVELITGSMQVGDHNFRQRRPAHVNVAGDADDPNGPTYATFGSLLDAQPRAVGTAVTERVDRSGQVAIDSTLAIQGVTAVHLDEVTHHAIAGPFWEFMNSNGLVYEDGAYVTRPLFESPYFATGRPITEAYWATVQVAGTPRHVLMQCFERRCLTYTPGNPEGFVVEAGNVGMHYYAWRYQSDGPVSEAEFTYEIDDVIVDPTDELPGLSGGPARQIGAMVDADGNLDEFALDEVVLEFHSQDELDDFLARYDATVIRDGAAMPIEGITPAEHTPDSSGLYLIRVDLDRSSLTDLPSNMAVAGFDGHFTFSSEKAARLVALLARERDLPIRPNTVMRPQATTDHPVTGGGNLDASEWPWMTEDDFWLTPEEDGLSVGVVNAWDYLEYMCALPCHEPGETVDWNPVYAAIIDGGFALDETTGVPLNDNTDYFYFGDKPLQVDMVDRDGTAGGRNRTSCGLGCSSPWHGQGSFGVLAARPSNNFGSAGTGGPVTIPILVRVDWTWYGAVEGMFTVGDATRAAGVGFGADIISLSLGGGCYSICGIVDPPASVDFPGYMQRAVLTATTYGAVVVAGAGNGSDQLNGGDMAPCELDAVICVGSIAGSWNNTGSGEQPKWAKNSSNYGSSVDIWAPTNILSTTNPDTVAGDSNSTCDAPPSTPVAARPFTCDELVNSSGTSAATPFVAGIIALMIALDENAPGVSPFPPIPAAGAGRVQAIQDILQQAANSSPDPKVAPGYVDAYQAVARFRENQPPTVSVIQPASGASASWNANSSYFQIEVHDPDPGANLPIFIGRTRVELTSDRDGYLCGVYSGYAEQSLFLCDRPEMSPGKHTIEVSATDPFGATAVTSITLNVINSAPTAKITAPGTGATFYADQQIQFSGSAHDWDEIIPDDQFTWASDIDGDLGTGKQLTASLSQGDHTITLTVTDAEGATGLDTIALTIQAGAGKPSAIILYPIPDDHSATVLPDEPIIFEGQGIDPEDGELSGGSLSWSSDLDGFLGTGTTIETSFSGPGCGYESVIVTLTVTDSDGNQSSHSIEIWVGRVC